MRWLSRYLMFSPEDLRLILWTHTENRLTPARCPLTLHVRYDMYVPEHSHTKCNCFLTECGGTHL